MNEKLRRLLGKGSKGNSSASERRKKRKRSALPSLLSQRSTATQNYYCRSINGQSEENCSESEENESLKKEGELIVETGQNNISSDVDRAIEVTLEPANISNATIQTLESALVQAKPFIKAKKDNERKTAETDLLLSDSYPHFVDDMIPEIADDAMEFTDHDFTNVMSSSSNSLEDNAVTEDERIHARENTTSKVILQTSQADVWDREETELKKRKATHQSKGSFHRIQRDHEQDISLRIVDVHTPKKHSEESSTNCAFLQQPSLVFCQDEHLQRRAVSHKETKLKLGICVHQQHFLQSLKNKPSSSESNSTRDHQFRRDYDWGWVSNDPQYNDFSQSLVGENPEKARQVCRLNKCSNNVHSCHFHHTCRCQHQDIPRHFNTLEECDLSHCARHNQECLNCCKTSPHCTATKFQLSDQLPVAPHTCECPNHAGISEKLRYPTISFTIRDENCFTRILSIPSISQDERSCSHNTKPWSNCHCHADAFSSSAKEREPRTPRACKRHLEDTKCFAAFRDSFESQENCFSNFDSSRQFYREKTAMAPTVVFLPHLQNICAAAPSSHQSCCCRRPSATRHPCEANGRHKVTKLHDRAHEGQKFPGHFQLSSKAYAKLIAYCHSKKLLIGLPYDNNTFNNNQASHSRNFFNSFESPLRRRPTHALNEYFELGQHFKSQFVYENQSAIDLCRLAKVFETVEECPWYWGDLSGQEAQKLLHGTPVGTFLLRVSSEQRYLFSLTMMTRQGPTSMRIVYENGIFRFDSDRNEQNARRFSALNSNKNNREHQQCVIQMILHYTDYLTHRDNNSAEYLNTHSSPNASSEQSNSHSVASARGNVNTEASTETSYDNNTQFRCSWMGRDGRREEIQVLIAHPHQKKNRSLQELCRTAINKNLDSWKDPKNVEQLPLPAQLKEYIKKYPYPV